MKLNELTDENWEFKISHEEKQEQGVHLYYHGVPYPRRVYYSSQNDPNYLLRALNALGTVKKFLYSLTYLSNLVIPRKFSIKHYETYLTKLEQCCRWTINEFLLKDDEWSVPVWEIGKLVKGFLFHLGLQEDLANKWSRIIMAILEYDNAYRYRVQDLLGEITHLDRSTLQYIIRLYTKREGLFGASEKILKLTRVLSMLLWIPKIKRALDKAQEGIDYSKIALDENDKFHTSFWRGYDYGGKTLSERYEPFSELFKTIPYRKREDPKLTADFMTGA